MTERPEGLDRLLDHASSRMDPVEAFRKIREVTEPNDARFLTFRFDVVSELLDRVDQYQKGLQPLGDAPEDVDAWLRTLIPDDKRLAFYQWIGRIAVSEAIEDVREDVDKDPTPVEHRYYSRQGVHEFLDGPEEGGPYPAGLPVGRPFCDVPHHTHTDGGGRIPTCRLDSEE